MKRLLRLTTGLLAILAFLFGIAHPLRVKSARGLALRGLKSVSEAVAPYAAAMGAAVAGLAALLGSPRASLLAAVGAVLSARYTMRVARQAADDPDGLLERGPKRLQAVQRAGLLPKPWNWTMPEPPCEPTWLRDRVYYVPAAEEHTVPPLLCDLWLPPPEVTPTGLALIYVHGGGYFTSQKDFGTRAAFRHLSSQGHVVMDIDYRLAPHARLFDMLSDVKQAVAWMKDNAEWMGARPDRIVLMGGSAGAHLAMLSAYAPNHPRLTPTALADADLSVCGVISYYGILDLAETYRSLDRMFAGVTTSPRLTDTLLQLPFADRGMQVAAWLRAVEPAALRRHIRENLDMLLTGLDESLNRLLGGGPDDLPDEYTLVSPVSYAGAGCPPTLLIQAEHDSFVPAGPARRMLETLRAAGVPAVLLDLPETEHTFDLFLPHISPPAQVALHAVERFLAALS